MILFAIIAERKKDRLETVIKCTFGMRIMLLLLFSRSLQNGFCNHICKHITCTVLAQKPFFIPTDHTIQSIHTDTHTHRVELNQKFTDADTLYTSVSANYHNSSTSFIFHGWTPDERARAGPLKRQGIKLITGRKKAPSKYNPNKIVTMETLFGQLICYCRTQQPICTPRCHSHIVSERKTAAKEKKPESECKQNKYERGEGISTEANRIQRITQITLAYVI